MNNKLDILAIGAHPDDVEIGMGGTLALHAAKGYKTGIVNLTKADLSSNGTVEKRQEESDEAARRLSVTKVVQLDFPDRGLMNCRREVIEKLSELIREYRPKLVFAPNITDRHPDHTHTGELVKEAVFNAGIYKYNQHLGEAHKAESLYFYQINGFMEPDVVVDVSDYIEDKIQALKAFGSQFNTTDKTVATPLTDHYLERVRAREQVMGQLTGVRYGEGFKTSGPLGMTDLVREEQS
ncbi:bacillithiol biosynthesis deacetylase BshB1 [Alteribacter keqinensis]|uniref:Bacillithiol biosynthesis deacetylase BshB1 n=1 Tax=Alteribacter keqinensis TaxID=2483800 RepID=A0A3M7TUE3_9BACI|nr:bacillithiol biosynthesis deacetylase BshB1 [Alteribacter keqinensis]RNA69167.1 bacillithiol biosynthesis deacetylase BshB1 [Alteribacter keqinensis]